MLFLAKSRTVEFDGWPRRGAGRCEGMVQRQAWAAVLLKVTDKLGTSPRPAGVPELILKRCAWHWLHRLAFTGVAKWRPLWPPRLSDGVCPWCARQVLKGLELQGRRTA